MIPKFTTKPESLIIGSIKIENGKMVVKNALRLWGAALNIADFTNDNSYYKDISGITY